MQQERNNIFGRQLQVLLEQLLRPFDPMKILHAGCSDGKYMELAHFGVDADEDNISMAASRFPEKDFMVADLLDVQFPDTSFDVIFCSFELLSWEKEKTISFFEKAYSLLRPNGQFLFVLPSANRSHPKEIEKYDLKGVKGLFPENKWDYKGVYGLQFLPRMNVPKFLDSFWNKLDDLCCQYFSPESANYILVIMQKEDYAFYKRIK